jgi:hypothetical protein
MDAVLENAEIFAGFGAERKAHWHSCYYPCALLLPVYGLARGSMPVAFHAQFYSQ